MNKDQEILLDDYFDEVDFGNGIRQPEGIISVRWPNGVCLKLSYTWIYDLTIRRDKTTFRRQRFRTEDGEILRYVKRWAKDICDGRYDRKKTEGEQIQEIITKRRLTSYMNNTKWKKFREAMENEMPFEPPYGYKTLDVEDDYNPQDYVWQIINNAGPHTFCSYDIESFNFFDYKSIEWVKVRPRFFSLEGGRLVTKQVWYDCEEDFVKILEKYSIPYELEQGVYTIYGYK